MSSTKSIHRLVLALALGTLAVGPWLARAGSSHTVAWSHWWCSPAAHAAASGSTAGGLGARLLLSARTLAVHWPHFLPLVLGLATLVYLKRANARYRGLTACRDSDDSTSAVPA